MSIISIPENECRFPNGKNVRVSVTGLAYGKLTKERSEIRFLRHVDKHELSVRIIQRNAGDNSKIDQAVYTIGKSQNVEIKAAQVNQPASYKYADIGAGEFQLKEIINMHNLHGRVLSPKLPPKPPAPSALYLHDFTFYTAGMTNEKFDLKEGNTEIFPSKYFGEILAGYLECTGGALDIEVPGHFGFPLHLPFQKDRETYVYDIFFNNACVAPENECESMIGAGETDLKFLYEILVDQQSPTRMFKLMRTGHSTTGVGACLPVIIDPPN
ncbi:MAG: hypothetical protein JSS81_12335 [Acidobacteria bacterium]|nr:hypothetical protein [Acidobacteriota bacterium]